METCGRSKAEVCGFVTSVLVDNNWIDSRPGLFTLGKGVLGYHYIGGWAGGPPTPAGTLFKEKYLLPLVGIEPRSFGPPGSSQIAMPTDLSQLVFYAFAPDLRYCILNSHDF
jgi:hypothetical protein